MLRFNRPLEAFTGLVAALSTIAVFFTPDPFKWLVIILAVAFAFVCLQSLARDLWEWQPLQSRIPVEFSSPIGMKEVHVRPGPSALPELGRVDFELRMAQASEAMNKAGAEMVKEMARNDARIMKQGRKLEKTAGQPVQVRHKALGEGAKVIHEHAVRMGRLEQRYRTETQNYIAYSGRFVTAASPDEDLASVVPTVEATRVAARQAKDAMSGYFQSADRNRAMNVSQSMNAALDELTAVLARIVEDMDSMISYSSDSIQYMATRSGPLVPGMATSQP